ncbi:MAG TPA: cytochrome b/b6 domain-containing protein [Hyphomonadaceae bacterium]|nr:cytochrome b/b6 domain-containing protein [Hyphomonadaceae bacterium]
MSEPAPTDANNSEVQIAAAAPRSVKVWDPIVRIGHWLLAGGFLTAYLTAEENQPIHVLAGYTVAAVVGLRIIWGFVGTKHARFAGFVRGPGAVFGYLAGLVTGKSKRSVGHNPAGAAMTIALLLCVGGTAISGMALLAAEEGEGPLAGFIAAESEAAGPVTRSAVEHDLAEGAEMSEEGGEEMFEEVHETFVNFTLLLIGLHIVGVIASSLAHRENLVRAMITGRKRGED